MELGGFQRVAWRVAAARQCDSSAWASSDPAVVDGGVHDRAQYAVVRADGRRRQAGGHLVDDVLNVEGSDRGEALRPERGNEVNAQDSFVAATSGGRLVAGDAEVSLHPLGEGEVTVPWVVPHAAGDVGLDSGEVAVRGGLRREGCRSVEQPVAYRVAVSAPAIDPRATFG